MAIRASESANIASVGINLAKNAKGADFVFANWLISEFDGFSFTVRILLNQVDKGLHPQTNTDCPKLFYQKKIDARGDQCKSW